MTLKRLVKRSDVAVNEPDRRLSPTAASPSSPSALKKQKVLVKNESSQMPVACSQLDRMFRLRAPFREQHLGMRCRSELPLISFRGCTVSLARQTLDTKKMPCISPRCCQTQASTRCIPPQCNLVAVTQRQRRVLNAKMIGQMTLHALSVMMEVVSQCYEHMLEALYV